MYHKTKEKASNKSCGAYKSSISNDIEEVKPSSLISATDSKK
eukprot:CAMPEP_0119045210 /NCGR_PEP_ID=MMETSP1177-20130426/38044_1 /TAXON_ID=2985 /ORGANISM="Ochromonas sp, Strain CCMP1899" /LENGTH=41 /DNA_ID= /DNA_START= /DNA_END= /DNA_ORIENTATION=